MTFSIAPAKMAFFAIYFSSYKIYIYLKRRINFLSNHDTHKKIKLEGFREKNYQTLNIKSERVQGHEVLAMKIISLEFLRSLL